MKAIKILFLFMVLFFLSVIHSYSEAVDFKIAVMQDQKDIWQKYPPLVSYLKKKGINVEFVDTLTYVQAADMFAAGKVDAMFSGSGVAGTMIIKNLATPVVRPLGKDGTSTYSAVILAHKNSPKFEGAAEYFKGKKVVFCSLASSGEIYYKSLPNIALANATVIKSTSHSAAIDTLSRGFADIAIVKNRVWDKTKTKYPDLIVVGEDNEENPDNTLIVTNKADSQTVLKVSNALLAIKDDKSAEAQAVRDKLNIAGYIKTTKGDFKHTFELLKKAGVDKSFNFAFN